LNPLKEKFGEFQSKVESLEKDSVVGRSELKVQIEQLRSLNERLSEDATNLVTALRGSSKTQGDWGEYVLESILESSGLRKGHEYRVQESFTRDDRSRARVDVILDLPEGRHIVLDSKVSLNDYSDYCAAEDEAVRDAALARHLASVRNHIRELSQRNYPALFELNSLDFVVMFIPIEPAFMLAIARDPRLWREAWDRNVILVSPSTLLFVLRTVANLWRQEQQTRNVQEIVSRGGELYDKLAAFVKDLSDIGKNLDAARSSYDEAYKKFSTGKGNAIRQAEMLKNLGIKPSKSMPLTLVEKAVENVPLELSANEEGSKP
jgi:DNA recombination protein RmuC